jgi:hydrogenase maturation protease
MKTIIVGIGNPILGDDGIGIHIIRNLKKHQEFPHDVDVAEAHTGGMNLLDVISGYDQVILVDAVSLVDYAHGAVKKFQIDELPTVHSQNPHDVSFPEALHLAKTLGDHQIPKSITIIGVNLKEIPREFSDSLSDEVKNSIPIAVNMILLELQHMKS